MTRIVLVVEEVYDAPSHQNFSNTRRMLIPDECRQQKMAATRRLRTVENG
jgi:hypothetical protein